MASRNYVIPTGSMSQSRQEDYRMKAVAAGIARAHGKKIAQVGDDEIAGFTGLGTEAARYLAILNYLRGGDMPAAFNVREAQPILDFGCALDQWNTAALIAVGAAYSVHQAVAAPVVAASQVAVYFKVGVETAPLPVSRVIHRVGGAAGNIVAVFDLEQLVNRLETDGFYSEPVVCDPNIAHAVQVLARIATGVLARVQFGCYIIESAGLVAV